MTSDPPHGAPPNAPAASAPGDRVTLEYDDFGRLILTVPSGARHVGVVPVRGFPFSAPSTCISFCDTNGREVYFLADVAHIEPSVRDLLEGDLARREFIPRIQRIYSVSTGAEPTDWHVLTDRGETRFVLNNEDSIRRLGVSGALITDSHGVRLKIEDTRVLDSTSRRILRRYL